MQPGQINRSSERGAMLVHVALGLLMLTALSAFAVDWGLFWVGRREAQNSADAAALAGAVALAYDDPDDFSETGPAKRAAKTTLSRRKPAAGARKPATKAASRRAARTPQKSRKAPRARRLTK